jgi:hypothetical protein
LVTVDTKRDAQYVIKMTKGFANGTHDTRYQAWMQHMVSAAQFAQWMHKSTFSFVSGHDY